MARTNSKKRQTRQPVDQASNGPIPISRQVSPEQARSIQENETVDKMISDRSAKSKGEYRIYAINPSNTIVDKNGTPYSAPAEGDTMMISTDYLTPEMEKRYYSCGAIRLAYESQRARGRRFSNVPIEARGPGTMMLQDDAATFAQGQQGNMPVLRPQ